jgi:hypothetical protein
MELRSLQDNGASKVSLPDEYVDVVERILSTVSGSRLSRSSSGTIPLRFC